LQTQGKQRRYTQEGSGKPEKKIMKDLSKMRDNSCHRLTSARVAGTGWTTFSVLVPEATGIFAQAFTKAANNLEKDSI
jgi:hypothetical protein